MDLDRVLSLFNDSVIVTLGDRYSANNIRPVGFRFESQLIRQSLNSRTTYKGHCNTCFVPSKIRAQILLSLLLLLLLLLSQPCVM